MTNGDRIRQMSNEELVDAIRWKCDWCKEKEWCEEVKAYHDADCQRGIKAYLESEVE